jgi:hypothetical protein
MWKTKMMPHLPGEVRNLIWDDLAEALLRKSHESFHSVDMETGTLLETKEYFLLNRTESGELLDIFSHPIAKSDASLFLEFLSHVSSKIMLICNTPVDLERLDEALYKCFCDLGLHNVYRNGHKSIQLTVHIDWDGGHFGQWYLDLKCASPLIKNIRVRLPRPVFNHKNLRKEAETVFNRKDDKVKFNVRVEVLTSAWKVKGASDWDIVMAVAALEGTPLEGMVD